MKKMFTSAVLATFFVSTIVFAMAKGPIKDAHKGKTGLEGAKVNCVYCHKKEKGNIAKKKGQDTKKIIKGNKYCAIKDCH